MKLITLVIVLSIISLSSVVQSAEVKNLRVGQEGKRAFALYDLSGKLGEKEADVTVVIEVGGEKYSAKKLTLSGDFGKGVKIGVGRKVYWDLIKDMPAGFDGEIGWDIEAASTAEFVAANVAEMEQLAKERDEQRRIAHLKAENERTAKAKAGLVKQNVQKTEETFSATSADFKVSELTVLDARTGLTWARNANIADKKMTFEKALSYAKKMNKENYGGYSDWRIPLIREYKTLFESAKMLAKKKGQLPLHIIKEHFHGYQNWYYWTSEAGSAGWWIMYAQSFDLEDGNSKFDSKNADLCFLPVRGDNALSLFDEEKNYNATINPDKW